MPILYRLWLTNTNILVHCKYRLRLGTATTATLYKNNSNFREEVEDLCKIHDDVEGVNEIIQSITERQEEFDVNDPDNLPPVCVLYLMISVVH